MPFDLHHLSLDRLLEGLRALAPSPRDAGTLELIVRRPRIGEREVLEIGELDCDAGLVGDTWKDRSSSRRPDGGPHPDMQINVMNARVIELIAQSRERWPLAGDQLYVDLDLSTDNLPAWTRLAIGTAVLEVTDQPHTGCGKFVSRFGVDAMKLVNSPAGRAACLRGINAKVVQPGTIRVGDRVTKLPHG